MPSQTTEAPKKPRLPSVDDGSRADPRSFYRSITIRPNDLDEENRTVRASISSEALVQRWFGFELLLHGKDNVDLSRLNAVGATLLNHNPDKIVGPLRDATLGKGRAHATLGFDDDGLGNWAMNKVRSGSLRGVSSRYIIDKAQRIAEGQPFVHPETGQRLMGPGLVATRWAPVEVSLTPIPADWDVGVGRDMTRSLDGIEIEAGPDPVPERDSSANSEGDKPMDERLRKYLEGRGLDAKASEEDAWKFLTEKLPDEDKKRAEAPAPEKTEAQKAETREEKRAETADEAPELRKVLGHADCVGLRDFAAQLVSQGKKADEVRDALFEKLKKERGDPAGPGEEETEAADLDAIDDDEFSRGLSELSVAL